MQALTANLLQGIIQASEKFPDASAVEFDAHCLSYKQLCAEGRKITSACLLTQSKFVGLLLGKTALTYTSVLGVLGAANAYIPMHLDFPESRHHSIIEQAQLSTLIVGKEAFAKILSWSSATISLIKWLIVETQEDIASLKTQLLVHNPQLQFLAIADQNEGKWQETNAAEPAYVLFTSGSTGQPKGIVISRGNLKHYMDWALPQFPLTPNDRCSQSFDLSFDLSVHDIFVSLSQGACLVIPEAGDLLFPNRYLTLRRLTVWFSVPSLAMRVKQLRLLTANSLPSLRYALFCGEGLPQETLRAWAAAAPNAQFFNLYGPTEATIACTMQQWVQSQQDEQHLVAIGQAFPQMQTALYDESSQNFLHGAAEGELWLSGPQLALGYLNNPEKTASSFVHFQDKSWYRTGDRVERDSSDILHFKGRIDFQVKIRGYRIELGEIEKILSRIAGAELWIALPWPAQAAQEIIAVYLNQLPLDTEHILSECQQHLPSYMIPARLLHVQNLPLNTNGKVDRHQLIKLLN